MVKEKKNMRRGMDKFGNEKEKEKEKKGKSQSQLAP